MYTRVKRTENTAFAALQLQERLFEARARFERQQEHATKLLVKHNTDIYSISYSFRIIFAS